MSSFIRAQEKEFHFQGQIVDSHLNPVSDVYILNYRNLDKAVSRQNGVFDMWVLPGDSLMISHVSFERKVVRVFDLMVNPIVKIEMDTVNILQIDVTPGQKTELERARENIAAMKLDPRPLPTDKYTEKEMVQELMNRENRVMRSKASSVRIVSFSPSEQISKLFKWIKRRKNTNESSNKKK